MQTYIFDFDGTLANSGKAGIMATQAAFKDFSLPEPSENIINYYMGIPIEVSFKEMVPEHEFEDEEFSQLLAKFREYYQKYEIDNLELFEGIMPTLEKLVERGKSLFVVSSKHSTALLRNLAALDIANFFTGVIGSDQVKEYKPAPDGVLQVLDHYKQKANNAVMIGDAVFDLQMGKAAGVKTCGVSWGAHDVDSLISEHPDYLLNKPEELLDI
ncbi:HAD family hydrolase [Lentilactobacillus sp. Marseille-Q4993]|uniref:HAD family hydrolase n=1 Tax=Lentilactobacillus sp. Marseille-Q4993 TaxID=3039492 RepID=UPI0024BCE958|nr:HAD family hydrolase [Lentilactobacillus sp. Marseille-Q4993]